MAYPTTIDDFTNPSGGDQVGVDVGGRTHSEFHSDNNNAIEALEAKVGVDSSADITSHDYKLSGVTGAYKAVSTEKFVEQATGFTLTGGAIPKTLTVALDGSVSGSNTGDQTNISGNAATATKLAATKTINGVAFDGSANITVPSDIAPGTSGNVLQSNGSVWTSAPYAIDPTLVVAAAVSISSAQILDMYNTPVELVPSPGAGKVIDIISITLSLTAGTQYAAGGNTYFYYAGTTIQVVDPITASIVVNSATSATAKRVAASNTLTTGIDKGVVITNIGAVHTTGTGTLKCFVLYRIITL
jgi:hypothetical protein